MVKNMKTGNILISKWLQVLRRQISHFSKLLVYNMIYDENDLFSMFERLKL